MELRSEIQSLSRRPVFRCLALVILFTASTRLEPLSSAVLDPDLWWHLRGGDAIVAQHALPQHGVFTRHTERQWVEYSWGFEVLASRVYHWFGLTGLVALRSSFEVFITAMLFFMLRRGLGSFWQSWGLTALGMWAIHHCLGLQPMLASVAMMVLELALIFEARRRGEVKLLYVLPILFLFWSNLHIQFVYGILALLLLAGATVTRAIFAGQRVDTAAGNRELPLAPLLVIAASSVIATLVGPYSWRLYAVLFDYVRSSVPYALITELQALSFRAPEHFVLVLILAGAFFALGWRHSRDLFKISLLVVCTIVGLRMMRDSWLACLPALAVIADRESLSGAEPQRSRKHTLAFAAATAVATIVLFALVAWDSKIDNASLAQIVARYYPADACDYVRTRSLPGPIYNDMNWGGFLIWALPEKPVAIDNRTDLYGDELLSRSYAIQQGFLDWKSDPDLNGARTVLLSRSNPLSARLAREESFQLAYEDSIAVVFVRSNLGPAVGQEQNPVSPEQTARK